jgi:hypothetical protein
MCHHAHVRVMLSAEDKKDICRLSGIMIPVYASIVLAAIAVLAASGAPRQGEQVAAASVAAAAR